MASPGVRHYRDQCFGGFSVTDATWAEPVASGDDSTRSVIKRCFDILAVFESEELLGVSELARATGLPRSTVFRLASDLVEVGALERFNRKYHLGLRLFELGIRRYPTRLRNAVLPYLEDLHRITGADVFAAALDGEDVVYVEHIPVRGEPERTIRLGARLPARSTAAGKVLLATMNEAIDPAPCSDGRHPLTGSAPLWAEYEEIRRKGCAVVHNEGDPGRIGAAVPVRNADGRVLGALSLNGPAGTTDPDVVLPAMLMLAQTFVRVGMGARVRHMIVPEMQA